VKYPPLPIFICFLLLGSVVTLPDRADSLEAGIFQVNYRNARELLPLVRPLLTAAGSATADSRTNSLVVIDTEETLSAVRGLLNRLDKPIEQFRIQVRFDRAVRTTDRSAAAGGRISGDGWEISKGENPTGGIHLRLEDKTATENRTAAYTVITGAGRAAYIRIGREIPYRTRWQKLCGKSGRCPPDIVFKRIDTGMEVTPRPAGDRVAIEITPRISAVDETGIVRFSDASVILTVPKDTWVRIGGSDKTDNEAIGALLETGGKEENSAMSMSIRVESLP
jgi:type II secretory pathway component HofQ